MMERLSTGEKQNLSFYKVETYPGFSTTQNGGISVASQFRQSQMDEDGSETIVKTLQDTRSSVHCSDSTSTGIGIWCLEKTHCPLMVHDHCILCCVCLDW